MKLVKIDYEVNGKSHYIAGSLVKEDELFFHIKSRDGLDFRVPKRSVLNFREVERREHEANQK